MIALVFGEANSAMPEPITSWTAVTTHSVESPSSEEAISRPTPQTAMPMVAMTSAPCRSAMRPPNGETKTCIAGCADSSSPVWSSVSPWTPCR